MLMLGALVVRRLTRLRPILVSIYTLNNCLDTSVLRSSLTVLVVLISFILGWWCGMCGILLIKVASRWCNACAAICGAMLISDLGCNVCIDI